MKYSPLKTQWPWFALANDLEGDFTPFIFYDRTGFTPKKLHDAIHLSSTSLLLNNNDNYGEMGQTWISDFKITFWIIQWNPSFDSWSINIIPKKLYARNKEKLSDRFWEHWQKVAKQPNLTFSDLSDKSFRPDSSAIYNWLMTTEIDKRWN